MGQEGFIRRRGGRETEKTGIPVCVSIPPKLLYMRKRGVVEYQKHL